MSAPCVTVLMPVYNGEQYLREALESILSQTFRDFEFLIINDGSIDGSVAIIQSYRDPRIRLLHNEGNQGLIATLNRGIIMAKTEYIARMDCDDISFAPRLEKQISFMSSNPDVAVCGAAVQFFGEKNSPRYYPTDDSSIRAHLLFECPLAHPAVMIRRKIFMEQGLMYSSSYTQCEDYDLWTRIPRPYRLANLGQILLKHRVHNRQVSREYAVCQLNGADAIRKRALKNLGVTVNSENLDLHSMIARRKADSTRDFLLRSEKWLTCLLNLDFNEDIYDKMAFQKTIGYFWWETCFHSTGLGFEALARFRASYLASFADISFKYKILFLLKCLFRLRQNKAQSV